MFANDSTLYKQRIQKLHEFSSFLKQRTINEKNKFDFDSSSNISKFYDSAITRFFNVTLLNSKYLSNGDTDFENSEFNLKFLKNCIASFQLVSLKTRFKKIKFNFADKTFYQTEPVTLDYMMLKNSIIYYTIDAGNEHDHLAFIFNQNNSELIGIVAMPYTK